MKKSNCNIPVELLKIGYLKKTNTHRFYFVINLMLVSFVSIFIFSCSNDDNSAVNKETPLANQEQSPDSNNDEQSPEVTNEISKEIRDLIYFKGDEKASTVLINVQSGPSTEFSSDIVDLIFENVNTTDLLTVNTHQFQTLNPSQLESDDITLDQAVTFNKESIEILYKVVSYFKDQGRTVYILGISFGAFITQELIAKKGIDSADKYLIMTGRLDINEAIWQGAAEGKAGFFENGITPIIDAEPDSDVVERNLNRITAGLGMNRYTQLFNMIEDLSNITYIYGATDQAVGSLTAEEVQFLKSKNTNIIAGSGNHDSTFEDFIVQGLKDTFGIELLP